MASAAGDIFIVAAVGVIGYLIYEAVTGAETAVSNAAGAVTGAVSTAAGAVASPIAAAIVWATSGSAVQPSGIIVLPDGTSIPVASVQNMVFNESAGAAGAAQFTYNGASYEILANPSGGPAYDTSGNYHAQQVAPTDYGVTNAASSAYSD